MFKCVVYIMDNEFQKQKHLEYSASILHLDEISHYMHITKRACSSKIFVKNQLWGSFHYHNI